jgi:hypothetical protein
MAGASGPDSGAPSTRVNQWQKSFTGLKVEAGLSSVAGSAVSNAGGAGAVQILGGVGLFTMGATTGVGVVVAGAAVSPTTNAATARSAYTSHKHKKRRKT